jgi:penicillin-binding protein 2A
MTKILKIFILIFASIAIFALTLALSFFAVTADAKLNPQKLISYTNDVVIYDDNGEAIESASLTQKRSAVNLNRLNDYTINAFIASEDRNFYNHNGLNYKRMLKALYKNVTSKSFKEGASTISQQLIKNTHLSGDKTIKRKLKEIKLTRQLERKYSKEQILQMYLNTIYFGHNCYGLESAAKFYFDVSAPDLTLEQSATIVGLLTSPNNYSPFKNPEKCLTRRNIVLKNMLDCNYITKENYKKQCALPLSAVSGNSTERYYDYTTEVFDEIEQLDLDVFNILNGCKIYTWLNKDLQNLAENADYDCDNSVVITNSDGGVICYKSTINGAKRQPGSTIKPLLVYAPAIQEKKIQSFTKIKDEKINFNGYSPENYDKKYHGDVTVKESLANSYNIPAVKILNFLTVQTAEKYAEKMDIKLDDEEKNLSLALGGMRYGLSLKQLCDRYFAFADNGKFTQTKFIKEIRDKNNNIIYRADTYKKNVFNEGTCSIMNDMLMETTKSGTAKKLKNINYDIACKTGTCGNENGNTDAYAISYTSSHCIGVWLGDKDNKRLNVTGGKDCLEYTKELLNKLYEKSTPSNLETNKGTETVYLDREEYNKNNNAIIADEHSPKLNKLKVKCLKDNLPVQVSTRFTTPIIKKPTISVVNNKIIIELCQAEYYSYLIKRQNQTNNKIIYDGKWKNSVEDLPECGHYIYSVTPYYSDGDNKFFGEPIYLSDVYIGENNQQKIPDIAYKDWYNF